jgi:predicted metal-dependent phosphoesterase TrpH
MIDIDLHSHTTRSDGLLGPRELVERAVRRGVKVLALTDHDTTSGLTEARDRAVGNGIDLVNGVEVSVTWNGRTLHIVGLRIDPDHPELAEGLASLRDGRRRRAESIADELEKAGVTGSLAGALMHVTNPDLVGRTHFARFLVEHGHAPDVSGAFKKFLAYGKPGHVPHQWARLEQAVSWIRASGGTAVLAHPGRYKLDEQQRHTLLTAFKDAGGTAVEVVTGSHSADQFEIYARYAQRYGLLASAGSDFHGPGESRRDLGNLPDLPSGCVPIWSSW